MLMILQYTLLDLLTVKGNEYQRFEERGKSPNVILWRMGKEANLGHTGSF